MASGMRGAGGATGGWNSWRPVEGSVLGKYGQRRVYSAVPTLGWLTLGLGWSHLGAEVNRQILEGMKTWAVLRQVSCCLLEGGQVGHSHAFPWSPGDCTCAQHGGPTAPATRPPVCPPRHPVSSAGAAFLWRSPRTGTPTPPLRVSSCCQPDPRG